MARKKIFFIIGRKKQSTLNFNDMKYMTPQEKWRALWRLVTKKVTQKKPESDVEKYEKSDKSSKKW